MDEQTDRPTNSQTDRKVAYRVAYHETKILTDWQTDGPFLKKVEICYSLTYFTIEKYWSHFGFGLKFLWGLCNFLSCHTSMKVCVCVSVSECVCEWAWHVFTVYASRWWSDHEKDHPGDELRTVARATLNRKWGPFRETLGWVHVEKRFQDAGDRAY